MNARSNNGHSFRDLQSAESNPGMSRRNAMKAGAIATVAMYGGATTHHHAIANPVGANDRVRIGVIGIGVRGKYLIGNLPESVQVTALCDCAMSRIGTAIQPKDEFVPVLADFVNSDAPRCATYQDYRRMLDREKLDAVIIATPDHHHSLAAMLALQAGLDVYLEKPLTVNIHEGRLLAEAVSKTGRILQVGSQQRTMEMNRFACEFIRDGGLGKITKVELPNYPGPIRNARLPAEPVPDGLDWNLFIGPTPMRPHHRKFWVKDEFQVGDLLWRGWDLYREYSGHIMTNWGAHSVDMVQYALGRDHTGPVEMRVVPLDSTREIGQAWKHKSPLPTSNRDRRFWPVTMKYDDGTELRFTGGPGDIRFYGERGIMTMGRNRFSTDPLDLVKDRPDPSVAAKWNGSGHVARPHLENWLECIRTRETPNAPVEVGHRTVTICHLANLARDLNRPLRWDPAQEQFVNDDIANANLNRPRRKGFELPTI